MGRQALSRGQRDWLLGALDLWRTKGIVSQEQALLILDQYETPDEAATRQRSGAVFTLMAIAGTFVGLAVLLLIGYNWEALSAPAKLILIFGILLGTHALAFHLRYRRQARITSEVVFFLACLLFGAGIWLVAQVFNLNAHYPDGFWYWAIGVLPFALCVDTLLLHALLVAILAAWAGTEILGFTDMGMWLFRRWSFGPNGAYSLLLLTLPGLWWAYRKASAATVGLYVLVLVWWVVLQPFAWSNWLGDVNPVYFIGAVGGLLLVIAESHRAGSPLAIPYRLYGVLLCGGTLVPLSYYGLNKELLRSRWTTAAGVMETLSIAVLTAATVVIAALIRRRNQEESRSLKEELMALGRRQWLPLGLVGLMAVLSFWDVTSRGVLGGELAIAPTLLTNMGGQVAFVPTLLANAAMLVFALWLMQVGLREDRGQPFAAGVLYFLLWAVLRYVDLFGDMGGMLGAAVMFFLCGASLFGVALYWRQRKAVLHD